MGTPPDVPWATIYFAIHKNKMYFTYEICHVTYICYIDNIFGIWIGTDLAWDNFKTFMNNYHNLKWKFSDLTNK
eukprot:13811778-Ditylum_brightwellii.AAC.1